MNSQRDWELIARGVLDRDFIKTPVDRGMLDALTIGLRGYNGICLQAMKKLETVTAVKWGKKDVEAGYLLPRRPGQKEPDER